MDKVEITSRKVLVSNTQTNNTQEVESSASTWGELKDDLFDAGVNYENMKAIVREGRQTLEADDSLIPTTNFTLFLFPVQTKSGAEWDTMGYNDIRKFATTKGISGTGSVSDIKARLDRWSTNSSLPEDAAYGKNIVPFGAAMAGGRNTASLAPNNAAAMLPSRQLVVDQAVLAEIKELHESLEDKIQSLRGVYLRFINEVTPTGSLPTEAELQQDIRSIRNQLY